MEFTDGHDPANCQLPAALQVSTKGHVALTTVPHAIKAALMKPDMGTISKTSTILESKQMSAARFIVLFYSMFLCT